MKHAFSIGRSSLSGEPGPALGDSLAAPRDGPGVIRFRPGDHPTISDCQIDSLKVLALTLLREIDALESTTEAVANLSLPVLVQRFEAELIRSALIKTSGRQRRAARLLGMKVTTLHTKIRRYNLDPAEIPQLAKPEQFVDATLGPAPVVKANLRSEGNLIPAIHLAPPPTRKSAPG